MTFKKHHAPTVSLNERKIKKDLTDFSTIKILEGESYTNLIITLSEITGLKTDSAELRRVHRGRGQSSNPRAR